MSYPKDPDKIVFRNDIYPNGLKSIVLYNYYMKNKSYILKQLNNAPIVMFMAVEDTKPLIVKRLINNELIKLNSSNYDTIIGGYTLSISMELLNPTSYYVVDIDYRNRGTELQLKQAVADVIGIYKNNNIDDVRVTNSSTGYHVYGFLKRKQPLYKAKNNLEKILKPLTPKYSLSRYNSNGIILDTSIMHTRGSITVPGGLTRTGIICSDVTRNYYRFNRYNNKIGDVINE
jgi:hypothetical protein